MSRQTFQPTTEQMTFNIKFFILAVYLHKTRDTGRFKDEQSSEAEIFWVNIRKHARGNTYVISTGNFQLPCIWPIFFAVIHVMVSKNS